MEWSSDGYALAVGWEKGWAIWSVGGRCLAWGFGVDEDVNNERYVPRRCFWQCLRQEQISRQLHVRSG